VPVEPVNTFLSWTPPGKSIVIRLDHQVVQRLNIDVMRGFGVTRRRGTETGGLLIGKIDRRTEPVIHIQEFEVVPCEYASGPSYVLSANDRQQFRDAVERWQPSLERDLYAVGYFRSHTREGFALDASDTELFREYFRDPLDVALLIKPFATRAASAGFFLQENGALVTNDCAVEFSFVSEGKGRGDAPAEIPQQKAAPKSASPAPISAGPSPVVKPPATKPPIPRQPFPSPAADRERPMFAAHQQEPSPWARRLAWTAFGIALLAFGCACGFEYGNSQARKALLPSAAAGSATAGAPSRFDVYSIHLQALQGDSNVMVKWDRDAAPIQAALHGLLTVTEGDNSKEVKLGFAELRNGTALYPHAGPEVRFRLELFFDNDRSFVETAEFRQQATRP
jgi:hypothetical protein